MCSSSCSSSSSSPSPSPSSSPSPSPLFVLLSSLVTLSLLLPSVHATDSQHLAQAKRIRTALSFQVEPKEEVCFFEDLAGGQTFSLEFEVVRGGLLDIKFRVQDPSNNILVDKMAFFNRADEAENEADGRVSFTAAYKGLYKLCFDNTMSRWTPKIVSFAPTSGTSDANKNPHDDIAKLEHLGPVVDSVIKIADELDEIERLQHVMRVREQNHRDMSETTNARVQWLAILETVLLIGMTAFQLHYIHSWFRDTIKVGRV